MPVRFKVKFVVRIVENHIEMLQESWMSKLGKTVFISAAAKNNIDALRDMLYDEVKRIHAVRYPYNNFLY